MRGMIGAATSACLFALPALAESPLQGQWKMTIPTNPSYVGTMRVDAEGRATFYAPSDNGRPADFRGYVAKADNVNVEIVFADGTQVVKAYCVIQSSDLLHCRNIRADEKMPTPYVLARMNRDVGKLWQGRR